jgi:heptosyltransferase-2
MVAVLRRRDPMAQITWICSETVKDLIRVASQIEVIPVSEGKLFRGSPTAKVSEVVKVWRALRGRRFDLAAIAHTNRLFRILPLTATVEQSKSLHSAAREWAIPGRYHGNEYVRLVTGIDGPDATPAKQPTIKLPLPESLLSPLEGSVCNLIILAPGGAKNPVNEQALRRWPVESYRLLAVQLLRRGFRVALTGAPSDDWILPSFTGLPVIDLIGKTSLIEQLALFGACSLVVTHDSGPLHVAQLAGTPTVALFGPTNPAEKVRDTTRVRVIWGGLNLVCRPCYDNKSYAPCTSNRCLIEIPVERVVRAIEEMLSSQINNSTGLRD